MTINETQPSSDVKKDPQPNQERNGNPKEALRFEVKDDGERSPLSDPKPSAPSAPASGDSHQSSEHQQSPDKLPSPVPKIVEPEEKENGSRIRVPLPEPIPEEPPQPVPVPSPEYDKPQPSSGLKQPLAVAAPLPWFTWFLVLLAATILFLCGISLWDTLNGLWGRSTVLGMAGLVLTVLLVLVTTAVAIQEWKAIQGINALEEIRQKAECSLETPASDMGNLDLSREAINRLIAIYASRDDTCGGSQQLAERQGNIFAASTLIELAEIEILKGLDDRAEKVIRDSALRVAIETAFMPWPLADVLLVFLSSMQMFRRIAQIYGSRPGIVASWMLSRKVLAQLVVAGALSEVGPWVDAAAGQGFRRLVRPIGEGITNATLLARSGVTAMELCRPLPFQARQRPSITVFDLIKNFDLIKKALVTLKRDGRNTKTAQQNG